METSLVTIAIPIYNTELYLRDAIQSVLNQTYQQWELLLMCDGSTDGSNVIVEEMADIDERIKVVNDNTNRGLIFRLNQSVQLANGKYYARMDADDIMTINRIEEEVYFLESHSDIDVVGSSVMIIDDKNKIVGSGYNEGKVSNFIHPTIMGKTTWFKQNPYANWALRAEDYELWLRTAANSHFYAIGTPLLFYREFGIPTLKKYYHTQCTLLKIYSRYKDYNKNTLWLIRKEILSLVKIVCYVCFAAVNKIDFLIKKRKRVPVPANMLLHSKDLRKSIESELNPNKKKYDKWKI